ACCTAQTWKYPELTWVATSPEGTDVWPWLGSPQHTTLPSVCTAHGVSSQPALTSVALRLGTFNCPAELWPKQTTLPLPCTTQVSTRPVLTCTADRPGGTVS